MTKPLNPEKSKKLRPLRVALAVLIAVLLVLILEKLPTSTKNRPENSTSTQGIAKEASPGAQYYHLTGFLEIIEEQTEARLQSLGVPEEEYQNLAEHFTKDEMYEMEAKVTLAAYLDSTYVEAGKDELAAIRDIFQLGDTYDFTQFATESTPTEYKSLADLLADYRKTLNTTEDYDAPAE